MVDPVSVPSHEFVTIGQLLNPHQHEQYAVEQGDHLHLARIALRIAAEECGSTVEPVRAEESYWVYTDGHWRIMDREAIDSAVVSLPHRARWVAANGNTSPVRLTKGLLDSVRGLCKAVAARPTWFERAQPGLAFRNGFLTWDLSRGEYELVAHSPAQRARHCFDFDFDPNHEPKNWLRFLDSCFEFDDDADARKEFLAQFIGAAITGQGTDYAKALMLTGTGSNGKSILCDVVEELFPRGSVVAVSPQDMTKDHKVARLAGAHLNLVSDIPTKDLRDPGVFKQITSGDLVEGRRLYQNPFAFRPHASHLFSCNRLPRSSDLSRGFWRRWVVMRFNRVFHPGAKDSVPREDLMRGLRADLPGIFNWALEGAFRLRKRRGYLVPASSNAVLDQWQSATDQARAFVQERCDPLPNDSVPSDGRAFARDIYNAYRDWADDNGHKRMSQRELRERLRDMGIRSRRSGGGTTYALRIKSRADATFDMSAEEAAQQEQEDA